MRVVSALDMKKAATVRGVCGMQSSPSGISNRELMGVGQFYVSGRKLKEQAHDVPFSNGSVLITLIPTNGYNNISIQIMAFVSTQVASCTRIPMSHVATWQDAN